MSKSLTKKILIVDDNAEILAVIDRILKREDYKVIKASNGKAALEKNKAEKPDLIVLDLMLPDIDGIEICQTIRKENFNSAVMIVILTAKGAPEHKIEGYHAGADDYIEKPFHRDEFIARIQAALRLKDLRDQLEDKNQQLIMSQKALVMREKMATIGLLAAGLAHEFNNIMAGISGYAQMAKQNSKYFPELIETALKQASRAKDIIDSLRTFIRPQQVHFLPVQLKDILDSVHTLTRKEIENKLLTISVEIEAGFPLLRGVPGQLQQIFLNLVLNAIHATEKNGEIKISAKTSDKNAIITISDTGCGISKQDIDRIFDPFYTTKGAFGGGEYAGTGLGLTVVYNLIRIHDANISVSSEKGKGTSFTIRIPTFQKDKDFESSNKTHVIVLSNDRSLEIQLQQILKPEDVTFLQDMHEAHNSIDYNKYTIAFIDTDLISGEKLVVFLSWLRCQAPELLIVIISNELNKEEALPLADRNLLKPCSPEVINGLLHSTCYGQVFATR